jgi:hypothetical protein
LGQFQRQNCHRLRCGPEPTRAVVLRRQLGCTTPPPPDSTGAHWTGATPAGGGGGRRRRLASSWNSSTLRAGIQEPGASPHPGSRLPPPPSPYYGVRCRGPLTGVRGRRSPAQRPGGPGSRPCGRGPSWLGRTRRCLIITALVRSASRHILSGPRRNSSPLDSTASAGGGRLGRLHGRCRRVARQFNTQRRPG